MHSHAAREARAGLSACSPHCPSAASPGTQGLPSGRPPLGGLPLRELLLVLRPSTCFLSQVPGATRVLLGLKQPLRDGVIFFFSFTWKFLFPCFAEEATSLGTPVSLLWGFRIHLDLQGPLSSGVSHHTSGRPLQAVEPDCRRGCGTIHEVVLPPSGPRA